MRVVSFGQLNTHLALDDGEYLQTHEAQQTAFALRRLFLKAGINPSEPDDLWEALKEVYGS
jgi:hypothetical protein